MKIEFFRHNISQKDIQNTIKALKSIFLSTGQATEDFEKALAKHLGCRSAVGVTSCTGAMHLSLEALGIGRGDEVITTPLSFVATAHAIIEAGAKPVFVDVEKETGNIDAGLIEQAITKRTKAILPVHLYGQMVDMKKISKIAKKHGLKIVEDAAHCLDGARDGVKPGQLSDTACFSLYATKSITCGEGGAVALNNEQLARLLKKTRLHGLERSAYDSYEKKFSYPDAAIFGWKYNMFDIQAAILMNQLQRIKQLWRRREAICRRYEKAFKGFPGIGLPKTAPGVTHGRHLFTIWVDPSRRDKIRETLKKKGVPTTVNYWPPIHLMTFYRKRYGYKPGDFPGAEEISKKTITLPLYPKLKDSEVDFIINSVKESVKI